LKQITVIISFVFQRIIISIIIIFCLDFLSFLTITFIIFLWFRLEKGKDEAKLEDRGTSLTFFNSSLREAGEVTEDNEK
jgi:hypothetical protein